MTFCGSSRFRWEEPKFLPLFSQLRLPHTLLKFFPLPSTLATLPTFCHIFFTHHLAQWKISPKINKKATSVVSSFCIYYLFSSLLEPSSSWVVSAVLAICPCFLSLTFTLLKNPHPRCVYRFEREKRGEREKHWLVFSSLHHDGESNPQPMYVTWLGTKPTTLWCTGCCSSQLSHQPGLRISLHLALVWFHFSQPVGLHLFKLSVTSALANMFMFLHDESKMSLGLYLTTCTKINLK